MMPLLFGLYMFCLSLIPQGNEAYTIVKGIFKIIGDVEKDWMLWCLWDVENGRGTGWANWGRVAMGLAGELWQ